MKNKLDSMKTKSIKINKNNAIEKGSKNSLNTVVPKKIIKINLALREKFI